MFKGRPRELPLLTPEALFLTRVFPLLRESVAKLGIRSLLKLRTETHPLFVRAPTGTDSEFCNTLRGRGISRGYFHASVAFRSFPSGGCSLNSMRPAFGSVMFARMPPVNALGAPGSLTINPRCRNA